MSVAVGMMARAPVPGRCKTRLSAALGVEAAVKLYEAMILDCADRYARLGSARRVVVAAPEADGVRALSSLVPSNWEVVPQVGNGLGDRIANAFAALEADGSTVLILGSDSPTLPVEPISAALRRLSGEGRVLLGPSDDGGYYLVGRTSAEVELFRDIPWSTSRVLETTLQRCAVRRLKVELLPSWYDVDDAKDLERLCAELVAAPEHAPRCAGVLRDLGLL